MPVMVRPDQGPQAASPARGGLPARPAARQPGAGAPSLRAAVSRRRFLRDAGAAAAATSLLSTLAAALSSEEAAARTPPRYTKFPTENPWPKYPAFRFAFVCHQTDDPFFVPTRIGAKDASTLLGTSFTWEGSASGEVDEMVDSFLDAIDNEVDGIACCVVDPKAFNGPTDQALAAGIPVIAFNAEAPAGSGNNALAYVGQDHFAAGAALARRAVRDLRPGQKVAALVASPSSSTERARLDGAASVFKAFGAELSQVVVGTGQARAPKAIAAWYKAHPDVSFFFASAGGTGAALAQVAEDLGLAHKGVRAAAFDIDPSVLRAVSRGVLAYTIDQQAYLQGLIPVLQLFIYNVSGGLVLPFDADTGHRYVTRENVGRYLLHRDTWEGSSTTPVLLSPPEKIQLA